MTAPGEAAYRFAAAWLLGCGLGVWYEFLRPLRPRFTALSDWLFLLGMLVAWIGLGFGICGGDLRLGYFGGLGLGAWVTALGFGPLVGSVFRRFWGLIGKIWGVIPITLKKFQILLKKCLHL